MAYREIRQAGEILLIDLRLLSEFEMKISVRECYQAPAYITKATGCALHFSKHNHIPKLQFVSPSQTLQRTSLPPSPSCPSSLQ